MTRFDEAAQLEPVLSEARRDVFHLRSANGWRIVALGSPALLMAGTFAMANVRRTDLALNYGAGALLAFSGAALMSISSFELGRHASGSRRALAAQGLRVRSVPPQIVPVLTTGTQLAALLLITVSAQDLAFDTEVQNTYAIGLLSTTVGLHVLALGASAIQLDQNKRARDATGWLGVAPVLSREQTGFAVMGRF